MLETPLIRLKPAKTADKPARQQAEASWRKLLIWIARELWRKKIRDVSSALKGLGILAPGARMGTTTRLATKKAAYRTAKAIVMRRVVPLVEAKTPSVLITSDSFIYQTQSASFVRASGAARSHVSTLYEKKNWEVPQEITNAQGFA